MLGCCPQIPHSVFLLFALLPSLLSTGNFLYPYPDWEHYPGLGLGSRNFHHHEDQNLRHRWHRRNSKEEPCQATPDIYFVLDKSESISNVWMYLHKFVVDMVQRVSNQDLRVSFITFSCKGTTILPITGDREEIHRGLERLKYSIPAGREDIYRGLWNANQQIIKVNSGGVQRPSMIISLLNSPLDDDSYQYSLGEADDARKMGASVYTVGVGNSKKDQVIGLSEKPENAFANKKAEYLKDLVFPLASKACPSLKSSDTRIICVGESNPVVLRGYGFDFAMRKEEVICRFYLSDIDGSFRDVKAINITRTTVTCPGPIVELPGKVIYVLLSMDNGRNFMNNNVFVDSKPCDTVLYTVKTTTTTTTRRPTTKTTHTTTTTTTTTTPSTTTTTPTTTLPTTTESPTTIPLVTEELKPSSDEFIFAPILLALLLTLLLIGCFWQLCCLPPIEELPPPKPQPQPREKKKPSAPMPPPTPAPAVNPAPIVIVCCCTCGGLCVSRDTEGNVIVCNCNHLSCHQLPMMWPQSGGQGRWTNVDPLKTLLSQETCGPRVSLPPSQEYLPLESCSQCHHFPGTCSRLPSRSQLLTTPSWVPRIRQSLPPMY